MFDILMSPSQSEFARFVISTLKLLAVTNPILFHLHLGPAPRFVTALKLPCRTTAAAKPFLTGGDTDEDGRRESGCETGGFEVYG
jgi:hypothetical protein